MRFPVAPKSTAARASPQTQLGELTALSDPLAGFKKGKGKGKGAD